MSIRKASVLELATAAYELDATVMRGRLAKLPDGTWTVGGINVEGRITPLEGQEIVVIVASLDDSRAVETRICPRCGRDYTGAFCPNCREARLRLRGR
jgi:hypothetical protein